MILQVIFIALLIQRIIELRLARRNEAAVRAQGAVEYGADHYWMFFVLHGAWMLGIIAEGSWRGFTDMLENAFPAWVALFIVVLCAQFLRFWAIASLGVQWNTRILVVPGTRIVSRGPYRWMRHPNYVAVVIELGLIPLLFNAPFTAMLATILNALLLLKVRIPVENAALATLDQ
jgi:methyltransferase